MKLREIRINNFRCLNDISIRFDDTTVFIGENNSGKTALLDAIRIPLTRAGFGKGAIFTDYDYSMFKASDTPQTCKGIIIELWFREDKSDEWPETLIQALNEIIQTDVEADIDSIGFRITSKYEPISKEIEDKVEFLALDEQPLGGRAASPGNILKFLRYIKVFYLSALRDSQEEFSSKSQHWGRILKNIDISEEQLEEIKNSLETLNDGILKADERLENVRRTLEKAQEVMGTGSGQSTTIQALPMKPWELMSKSELVIKPRGSEVQFPLSHHGQGTQSLAVLFLFQAYIDVLLRPNFEEETEAIIAFEEPESHLHPQAARALASSLSEILSQKIISSHSPYFIQEIPFTNIRMFSRIGNTTNIYSVRRYYSTLIPYSEDLSNFCQNSNGKYKYIKSNSCLLVYGQIDKKEYRKLAQMYNQDHDTIGKLKIVSRDSQAYISDAELADLETNAKRIRGEILFAKGWILCEGQCEYLLLRYFAEIMNKSLDYYGISIIDFKNSGSEGSFISLAMTFHIPWIMLCDNDNEGKKYRTTPLKKGISEEELGELVITYPEEDMDMELYLVKHGLCEQYLSILEDFHVTINKRPEDPDYYKEIATKLRSRKTEYTITVINRMKNLHWSEEQIPELFKHVIESIIEKVK